MITSELTLEICVFLSRTAFQVLHIHKTSKLNLNIKILTLIRDIKLKQIIERKLPKPHLLPTTTDEAAHSVR